MRNVFAKALFVLVFSALASVAHAVPYEGHKVMIAGPSPIAAEVGKMVAEDGGNVIDVAVAVGLTLSVTSPYYAALGGGGFALIKMGQKVEVLDFREMAPKATSPDFFVKRKKGDSRVGGAAVGVPGWPAGLVALHEKYGKLRWYKLFQYPVKLAERGFRVSGEWVGRTKAASKYFNDHGQKHFTKKKGYHYLPGEKLKQGGLARALKSLRRKKLKGFYEGRVANDIIDAVRESGGVMTMADLKDYKVRWLEPLTTDFNGHKIYLMPPPSSGGVVIKSALKLIEQTKLSKYKPLSLDETHFMGEILSRAFRGRALLGDPDFHSNPLDRLLSENYLNQMAKSIKKNRTTKLTPLTDTKVKESTQTTHFSVMDSEGNAIALTVTLNGNYGSGVVSKDYGVALNNEMDDFTTRPGEPNMFGLIQGKGNYVQPGKRPLSSMSPTLVEKNGKIVMTVGSPGGPRIISGVLQVLYRTLVNGFNIDEAIQFPRVHHQFLPHTLFVEEKKISPEIISGLKSRGHDVKSNWMGKVYGVRMNDEGNLEAAFDSRGEGGAAGF